MWGGPTPVTICHQLCEAAVALANTSPTISGHSLSDELKNLSQYVEREIRIHCNLEITPDLS